jgi:hypothetical protein
MSDVFLERNWDEPLTTAILENMIEDVHGCFGLYRVEWQESLLSTDGKKLLCHFRGPDAESVRVALRQGDADVSNLWPGTVHDAPGLPDEELRGANVVVLRKFDEPVALEDIQAIEDANIACLETHRVKFVRTFFSSDRRRMACLYRAPDAESVRIAQRQANMPVERVWAVRRFSPESL